MGAYLLYGKALLNVSIMENEVLGNALDGMELEDDSKSLPQVESPTKLDEKEKVAVVGDVVKAFNEHYDAINVLAKHHFAEDSDDSDVRMLTWTPILQILQANRNRRRQRTPATFSWLGRCLSLPRLSTRGGRRT